MSTRNGLRRLTALHRNCHYCQQQMVESKEGMSLEDRARSATIDHIIPASEGGSNNAYNLVVSCARCNNLRGTMPYDAFFEFALVIIRKHPSTPTPILRSALIRFAMILISYAVQKPIALRDASRVTLLQLNDDVQRFSETGKTKRKGKSNVK